MNGLKEEVEALIRECSADVSIYMNLFGENNVSFCYGSAKEIEAGNSIMISILLAVLSEVQKGSLSLDQKFIITKDMLSYESQAFEQGRKVYSLNEIISYMIIMQDATAANLLIDLLGFDKINSWSKNNSLNATSLNRKLGEMARTDVGYNNYTSVADMYIMFDGLYNEKIISPYLSRYALGLLKAQRDKSNFSRYIYEDIQLANSTSNHQSIVHDVGIFYLEDITYFLGMFVTNIEEDCDAGKLIASISYAIFKYIQTM